MLVISHLLLLLLLLQVANTLAKEVLTAPGQDVQVVSTNVVSKALSTTSLLHQTSSSRCL